jgi:hypothetical protein
VLFFKSVLPGLHRLQDRQQAGAASAVTRDLLEQLEKGKAMYSLDCHRVGPWHHTAWARAGAAAVSALATVTAAFS